MKIIKFKKIDDITYIAEIKHGDLVFIVKSVMRMGHPMALLQNYYIKRPLWIHLDITHEISNDKADKLLDVFQKGYDEYIAFWNKKYMENKKKIQKKYSL